MKQLPLSARMMCAGLAASAWACGGQELEPAPPFDVRPGVEIATVTGAEPRIPLTLYGADGQALLTLVTDEFGQAHFAYIPDALVTLDSAAGTVPMADGHTLKKGQYVVRADSADPPESSAPFAVLGVDDVPDVSLYEGQSLTGVRFGLLGVSFGHSADEGFNYLVMRDGVELSAMVRFPDRALWGDGPWPTVIEYSGYSPSNPDGPEPGTRIATLLGYATVAVNMRGTGCSGGVFDVFNPAQHADGYDIVEIVARQPWVLHNRVGMVGLSYSGIAQLFVGYTRPPSLAALTPLSVIADPWVQQWPGGVYNGGFTRQWLEQRDASAASGGQSWTDKRIEAGDTRCAAHQDLRRQNIDFESFFRLLEFYPPDAADRSLPLLVADIEAPVFLTGAWQDEQTGAEFGAMLDRFGGSVHRFTMFNGRHPDGYSPLMLGRWLEFLELYVARRVPRLDEGIRDLLSEQLSGEFGLQTVVPIEANRFAAYADDEYAAVLAAYEAEPPVRVLFESGAGGQEPGAPVARFEASYATWPPPAASGWSLYLDGAGSLGASAPTLAGADSYLHDPEAGSVNFFGPQGYQLTAELWDIDWTQFPAGRSLSYVSAPLAADTVVAGPGWAELWFTSDVDDVDVQVSLTEVRPDTTEVLVQSGWLRLGHRKVDETALDTFRVRRTYAEADFEPLVPGQMVSAKIAIPSVAHAFRAGSQLRVVIGTPGRNHGTWQFESPDYGGATPKHIVAFGPQTPSRLFLPVVSGVPVAAGTPPCPSLRGQPCRAYVASANTSE
ncbi:MAG: CocE/NonD family hydrolase [Myxococcales bacterium]|nr:CocE/NonD family hydrolase [Myxococcales bacterium]